MMWRRGERHSTLWRLTPIIALCAAAALLVTAGLMVTYLNRSYREQKIAQVSVQAAILASTVTAALAFSDRRAGQEYVDALQVNPELEAAAVYDAGGTPFVSFLRGPGYAIPDRAPVDPPRFEGDRLIVVSPVMQGGTALGTVYLRTMIEPIARRLQRYALLGALVFMATLLVAVLGFAQRALGRANAELERRGEELSAANASLLAQIAQRERVEAALRQVQKMEAIGQLTGGIAHDFNNLLQVILGSLERLARRLGDPARQTDPRDLRLIENASRGADRAAVLTRRLLAFSRRQTLDPAMLDVNRLVGGMSDSLLRTLGPEINVETVLDGRVWPVFADENQLENALLNLAVNARDAMPEGGRLVISTSNATLTEADTAEGEEIAPGEYAQITVTDSGVGMSKEVVAKAFDPFFTTKDIGQGTGLGLSQVYGFVKQSGGHVKIVSTPGLGTSVQLYLPRPPADMPPEVERDAMAPRGPAPRGKPGETILLVEDEDDVRMATVDTLRGLGYDVIEARDGPIALRRLEQVADICLLFTDVGLPGGMNGVQLAEAARRRHPGLPVLFTTGYARDAFAAGSPMTAGGDVLSKPFSDLTLARKLREVLDAAK